MDEIEILPQQGSPVAIQLAVSPRGESYSMSIRDYQSLGGAPLKVNRKGSNRIMGNRKQSPSEKDRDSRKKQALTEIFDLISHQEEERASLTSSSSVKRICHYHGRDIPYTKRTKG